MVDENGNDLGAVGVVVTGSAALAPFGTAVPTPSAGANPALLLDELYKGLGLRTEDGGPQWAWEKDGDPLAFFEDGYSIPTGLANVTCVMKLAQTDAWIREVISGQEPDEHGYISFDGGGHATRYVLFTEEVFRNLAIRRRVAGLVTVDSVAEDKAERGSILGYEVTFKIERSAAVGGGHFGEWVIPGISGAPAWVAETAYAIGNRVSLPSGAVLECTTAGTSDETAPTAPAINGTVVDATVTWKRIA